MKNVYTLRELVFSTVPFLVLLLVCRTCSAQEWTRVLGEVQKKYERLEKELKDMTIQQEIKTISDTGEVFSEIKVQRKGDKFRIETRTRVSGPREATAGMEAMETTVICDGKDTWIISPFIGEKKLTSEEARGYRQKDWWKDLGEDGRIVGTEKIQGRECYIVEFEKVEGSMFTKLWLDKKDLVVTKSESKGSKEETILCTYSDFRKIERDWEVPYRTEVYTDGKIVSISQIKSVRVNTGLADDLFVPGEEGEKREKAPPVPGLMKRMILDKLKEKGEEKMDEEIDETIDRTFERLGR